MIRNTLLGTILAISVLIVPVSAAKKPKQQHDWKTGILLASPDPGYTGLVPQNTFLIRGGDLLFHVQLANGWSIRKPDVTERGPVKYTIEDGVFYLLDDDGREFKMSVNKKELRPLDSSDSPVGAGVYRIEGNGSSLTVIYKVEPEYSEEARKANFQGTVVLFVVVDEDGIPRDIKVVRPLGLGLDQKAVEAVRQWRFKPPVNKDGKPTSVQATIEVNFGL